jgi:hypothetical protein
MLQMARKHWFDFFELSFNGYLDSETTTNHHSLTTDRSIDQPSGSTDRQHSHNKAEAGVNNQQPATSNQRTQRTTFLA